MSWVLIDSRLTVCRLVGRSIGVKLIRCVVACNRSFETCSTPLAAPLHTYIACWTFSGRRLTRCVAQRLPPVTGQSPNSITSIYVGLVEQQHWRENSIMSRSWLRSGSSPGKIEQYVRCWKDLHRLMQILNKQHIKNEGNLHCPAGKFFIIVFFFLTFAAVFELQKRRLLPTDLWFNLTAVLAMNNQLHD